MSRVPLAALLALLLVACAPAPARHAADVTRTRDTPQGSQADCQPGFPDQHGWYGGDAAYSVALPTGDGLTSLWLFGDSFVERPEAPDRRAYPFVHNTIALSRCTKQGRFELETFWRRPGEAGHEPGAFFEPDPAMAWVVRAQQESAVPVYYWPLDAFVSRGVLFVGLLRVGTGPPSGPFRLPFRLLGVDLARIENPSAAPCDWQIRISQLSDDRVTFPGSAFVEANGFVYAFGFASTGDGRSPRLLTRLPIEALAHWQPDLSASLETWTTGGVWASGVGPTQAAIVMDDDSTEMSVHFDAASQEWIAVYTDPTPDSGGAVVSLRRADRLEGPWSAPETLFRIPELAGDDDDPPDPNLMCYAGKAHRQFADAGRLLVTYTCNLFARSPEETGAILRRLAASTELYRPRVVPIAVPAAPESN